MIENEYPYKYLYRVEVKENNLQNQDIAKAEWYYEHFCGLDVNYSNETDVLQLEVVKQLTKGA